MRGHCVFFCKKIDQATAYQTEHLLIKTIFQHKNVEKYCYFFAF